MTVPAESQIIEMSLKALDRSYCRTHVQHSGAAEGCFAKGKHLITPRGKVVRSAGQYAQLQTQYAAHETLLVSYPDGREEAMVISMRKGAKNYTYNCLRRPRVPLLAALMFQLAK